MDFTGINSPLDRVAHQRGCPNYLAARHAANALEVLLVREGRLLMQSNGDLVRYPFADLAEDWELTLLGERDDKTIATARPRKLAAASLERHGQNWARLRQLFGQLAATELELAAYASAMNLWSERNQFCGHCGSPATLAESGFRRQCTNPQCGRHHFPRIDPAVIMAVENEGDILLGRQPSWPARRYSTLAGFVEPGESLEQAVAREVAEETGVAIAGAQYIRSQPWPFPSSLMLGFIAEATTRDICLDDELEDARWFSLTELKSQTATGALRLPTRQSVSYRLIRYWLRIRHRQQLDDWEVSSD